MARLASNGWRVGLLTPHLALAACAQIEGLDGTQRVACLDDCPGVSGAADSGVPPIDAAGADVAPGTSDGGATEAGLDAHAPESGIDGTGPDSGVDATPETGSGADSPTDAAPQSDSPTVATWAFHRAITLSSDAAGTLTNEPVLVVVPASFDATRAKPGGDDLRFSTTATHADDLTYFIESWNPGAASYVWVRVPSVPVGASTIHAFYGNPAAAAASSFASTFPNAQRTAGGGAGSFIATADIVTDWFELRAGDTLILPQGAPLHISARRVILSGTVGGNGRGSAGGAIPDGVGGGPAGGGISTPVDSDSSGGGGYGGTGGTGGGHGAGHGGPGGAANGTASGNDLATGSGGGASNANAGGAGGGAVSIVGWRTTVLDVVRADGLPSVGGSDRNGGGGAGGGILVAGYSLELAGATFSAIGGAGGNCLQSSGSGGGGGSGGRIKLKHRPNGSLTSPAATTVTGGPGGTCTGSNAAGVAGAAGTTSVDAASTLATGVEADVGAEQSL